MLVCYQDGRNKITKDFSSVEILCDQPESRFSSAIYSIVGVHGSQRVTLCSGLSYKKAKERLAEIHFSCANHGFSGGVYYV